jgi:hypothetical protein
MDAEVPERIERRKPGVPDDVRETLSEGWNALGRGRQAFRLVLKGADARSNRMQKEVMAQ